MGRMVQNSLDFKQHQESMESMGTPFFMSSDRIRKAWESMGSMESMCTCLCLILRKDGLAHIEYKTIVNLIIILY